MVINAQDIDKSALRQAIERQLATYPKSQLQDIYKAFYQEHFGAEHMITDKEAARNYLDQELATMQDKRDGIYVEPIGMSGDYVRVYLIAVSHKILSSSQLLKAFIESAGDHKSPTISWATKWQAIATTSEPCSCKPASTTRRYTTARPTTPPITLTTASSREKSSRKC